MRSRQIPHLPTLTLASLAVVLMMLALGPASASARIEEGRPELYENTALAGPKASPTALLLRGQLVIKSSALGGEGIQCQVRASAVAWNEGAPMRAIGQILSWGASGHRPEGAARALSASCGPEVAGAPPIFVTDEAPVPQEENEKHEVEPALRATSAPWNVEARCGDREEEEVAIVKVGVPDSAFPMTLAPCPTRLETGEAEELILVANELTEKRGCYATIPAPPGCVRITAVEPAAGLEVAFGGTWRIRNLNGVHNALLYTQWSSYAAEETRLQCEVPAGCSSQATIGNTTMAAEGFSGTTPTLVRMR